MPTRNSGPAPGVPDVSGSSLAIGRPLKDEALRGLQEQLAAGIGVLGYTVLRRTLTPHVRYLSVAEFAADAQTRPKAERRYETLEAVVAAMHDEPEEAEIRTGVYPGIVSDRAVIGGLALDSYLKPTRARRTRRLYLYPNNQAEDAGLREERRAVLSRVSGEPLDDGTAAALPGIAIPLVSVALADGATASREGLQALMHGNWAIPDHIVLGPLGIVDGATAAVGYR